VFAAIGRSVTLTKPHAMHVLGLVLTRSSQRDPQRGIVRGDSTAPSEQWNTVAVVIGQSVASASQEFLTTPFIATATVALYFDLRIRDEAYDVQASSCNANDARIGCEQVAGRALQSIPSRAPGRAAHSLRSAVPVELDSAAAAGTVAGLGDRITSASGLSPTPSPRFPAL